MLPGHSRKRLGRSGTWFRREAGRKGGGLSEYPYLQVRKWQERHTERDSVSRSLIKDFSGVVMKHSTAFSGVDVSLCHHLHSSIFMKWPSRNNASAIVN